MKKIQNNDGMALVMTLLIIVVFTVLGMTLLNFTTSNAKQINKNEVNMQATDLAEMGVVHYKNALTVHVDGVLNKAISDSIKRIEILNKNKQGGQKQLNYDMPTVLAHMTLDPVAFLPPFTSEKQAIQLNPGAVYSYQVTNPTAQWQDEQHKDIHLTFTSRGYTTNGKESVIGAEMNFSIEDLVVKALGGNTGGSGEAGNNKPLIDKSALFPPAFFDSMTGCTLKNNALTLETNCHYQHLHNQLPNQGVVNGIDAMNTGDFIQTGNLNGLDDFHFYVTGEANFGNVGTNQQAITDSIIYAGQGFKFNDINGNISGATFYSEEAVSFKVINTALTNSKIYSGASADFERINNLENSLIVIEKGERATGNLTIKHVDNKLNNTDIHVAGDFTLEKLNGQMNHSNFYVKGNFINIIGMDASLQQGSKIMVEGDFIGNGSFNLQVDHTSLICVGGEFKGQSVQNAANNMKDRLISKVTNPAGYAEKCGVPTTETAPIAPGLQSVLPDILETVDTLKLDYS